MLKRETSVLPPSSDHVMIHLGGENYGIYHTQLIERVYIQKQQLLQLFEIFFPKCLKLLNCL